MEHVESTIDVEAPLSMVYNQWTQFEEFPRFMEGVESVRQLDDKRLYWKANVGGHFLEWEAEIFEQIPDQRVAWRSMDGAFNSGMVNFQSLGPNKTRVCLKINFAPRGVFEKVGSAMGVLKRRVEADLERFKEFIESRGTETGAWRGRIEGKEVDPAYNISAPADAMPRSKRLHTPPLPQSKPARTDLSEQHPV